MDTTYNKSNAFVKLERNVSNKGYKCVKKNDNLIEQINCKQ